MIDPPVGPDGESAQDGFSNVGPRYVPTAFGEEGLNWEWQDGIRFQNAAVETIPYRLIVSWAHNGKPDELHPLRQRHHPR